MKVPVTIDLNCLFPPIAPIFEDFQSEWAYINHQGVYNCRIHNLGSCARKLRQPLGRPQLHIIAHPSWLQRSITSLSSNLKTKNWKPQHWSDLNDAFWLRCRHLVTAHASSTSLAFNQNRYIQNTKLSRLNQIKFNVSFYLFSAFCFLFYSFPNPCSIFLALFKTKTFSSRVHSAVNCAPLICHHRLLFMIYFLLLFTHLLLIIDHLLFVYCLIYFSSTALNSKHNP